MLWLGLDSAVLWLLWFGGRLSTIYIVSVVDVSNRHNFCCVRPTGTIVYSICTYDSPRFTYRKICQKKWILFIDMLWFPCVKIRPTMPPLLMLWLWSMLCCSNCHNVCCVSPIRKLLYYICTYASPWFTYRKRF